jgi:hypothetical protein
MSRSELPEAALALVAVERSFLLTAQSINQQIQTKHFQSGSVSVAVMKKSVKRKNRPAKLSTDN